MRRRNGKNKVYAKKIEMRRINRKTTKKGNHLRKEENKCTETKMRKEEGGKEQKGKVQFAPGR